MKFLNYFTTHADQESELISIKKTIGFDEAIIDSLTLLTRSIPKLLIDSKKHIYGLEFFGARNKTEKIMEQFHQKLRSQGYFLFYLSFFDNLGLIRSQDQFDILRYTEWWGFNEKITNKIEDQFMNLKVLYNKYHFEIHGGSEESLELYFPQIPESKLDQIKLVSAFESIFPDAEGPQTNLKQTLEIFTKTKSLTYRS